MDAFEESSTSETDMEAVSRRYPVLAILAERPLSRSQLADRLDVSRATVHRATESLADLGLVDESPNGVVLTTLGRVAELSERNSRRAIAAGQTMGPVLEHLDSELFVENLHRFAGAEVIVDDQRNPMQIESRIVERIDDTARMKRATNWHASTQEVLETIFRNMEAGMPYDLVVPTEAWNYIQADYADELERYGQLETTSLYVNDDIPFSFYVVDRGLLVSAFDEGGRIVALAETDADDAVAWADRVFAALKARGEQKV